MPRLLSSLIALAAAPLVFGAPRPDYPSSKHGGTYMFNYYLPPAPSSTPWAPAWSPDGKWIAVAMYGSIWKVDPDSGTAFELSYNRKYHSSPAWSPDGKWIVYTADDNGSTIQLEAVNAATGESRALTNDAFMHTDPVFSPDGTKVAYVSTRPNGYFNVYARPIRDGQWAGEEIPITQDNNYGKERLYFGAWDMHAQPSWTPNSKEVVLVSNRTAPLGSGFVWRVPAEPNAMPKARLILQEETLYRTRPDVSGDGRRIIFSSSRGAADQFNHLYIIPMAGGEPYKLTFGDYDEFHPRWSPDGERIAYISNEGGLPQLWVLESFGGARKRIHIQSRRWRRPMGFVKVRVQDETGNTASARIYADAADGKFYAPPDAYSRISSTRMTRRLNDHVFHSDGEFTLEVPPGKLSLEAVRGFEHWPAKTEIEVKAGEMVNAVLTLKPMVNMGAKGWYGGSTHAHMNYAGNLRNTPEHMKLMGRAEDLDVVNILVANKDSRVFDNQYFEKGGVEHSSSGKDPKSLVIVGEEWRPPFWGHVFYIGLRDHLISPFTAGYPGSALESLYPSNTDMFRKAIAQGAAVGYVHAFGGDRDPLEGNLGGGKGFAVDAALGTTHAIEWSGSSRGSYTVLHHALNNDLRIAPVGGEDANTSLHRHTMMGSVRTYAYTGQELNARRWIDAVIEGKTFFSNGPLLEFSVDGSLPGESVRLPADGGSVTLKGEVWSFIPLTRVMIYRNGKVWKEIPLAGNGTRATFEEKVAVSASTWFSLSCEGAAAFAPVDRSFPQAGTNAIRVYVGDQKIRSRESAEYFIAWIDKLRAMAEKWPGWGSQREKDHVFSQFAEARRRYEQFAKEATAPGAGGQAKQSPAGPRPTSRSEARADAAK